MIRIDMIRIDMIRIDMIRIDMIRHNDNHPDRRKRHPSQASCEVDGQRYETTGPAPIYKLTTLLWLHGHGGEKFEAHDNVSPTGRPGGLAMRGKVRNWASFETPKGMPMFRMKSMPDPDFTLEQRATVAKAAGVVVSCDADSRETPSPGRATRPSDDLGCPEERDGPSAGVIIARSPGATQ